MPEMPRVSSKALLGDQGVALTWATLAKLGFQFKDQTKGDFGIDAVAELLVPGTKGMLDTTARQIAIQIKYGDAVAKPTSTGFRLYCSAATGNYWLSHSLPVVVVYWEAASQVAYWASVTPHTLRATGKMYALEIPRTNRLTEARDALADIASNGATASAARTHLIRFSETSGITLEDDRLGILCLSFSRERRRGEPSSILVEVEGEAGLLAAIPALADPGASIDDQKLAIIYGEIADRYERKAKGLARCLDLVFGDERLARAFGTRTDVAAQAARAIGRSYQSSQGNAPTGLLLQAWPAEGEREFSVSVDLTPGQAQAFLLANDIRTLQVELGPNGGLTTSSLGELYATAFLPSLARRLIGEADRHQLDEQAILDTIPLPPELWWIGLR